MMDAVTLMPNIRYSSLAALADEAAAWYGDRAVWESIEDGTTMSFNDFRQQTLRCANGLRGLGIGYEAHVAVMLPNVPAYVVTWFALARLGAVMVPVNTRNTSRELEFVLRNSDAGFLVIDENYLRIMEGIENLSAAIPSSRIVVHRAAGATDVRAWHALVGNALARELAEPRVTPDTQMSIQYTSGSSGLPKGCVLSQDYWVLLGRVRAQQGPAPTRLLIDKPLSYMGGMWRFLMCLCLGCTACVAQQFSLRNLQQRLVDNRIDFFAATDAVAKLPDHPGIADLNVAWISIAGLSKALHRPLEQKFRAPVRELYGLTETGSTLYMPASAAAMSGSGSCGLPAPYRECRIVDDQGRDVPRGKEGELWVRGRGILQGYYGNPEATHAAFSGDWFRTGDLFSQDAEGYYYIQGRIKDSIRRSGENISAREVEMIASGIPGVLECAAVGVPDELRGQEIKLCLVLQPGRSGASITPQAVIAHCAERLAAFKVPRYVEYFEDLPRTSSGKIAKHELVNAERSVYDRTREK